jgi:trehalose/maltose transport system substrate-binding protein
LPIFSEIGGLYYRPDLLRRYGFTNPPTTWDELELQARTIMAGERKTNPAFQGLLFHTDLATHEGLTCVALEWLALHDAAIEVTNGRVRLNQPQAVAVLNRAQRWMGTLALPVTQPISELQDGFAQFRAGQAAFLRAFSYTYLMRDGAMEDVLNDTVAFAPLPSNAPHGPVGVVGMWLLGMLQRSTRQDDAVTFLREYAGTAAVRYRALLGQTPPLLPHLAERMYACNDLLLTNAYKRIQPLWRPWRTLGWRYPAFSRAFAHSVHRILAGEDAVVVLAEMEPQVEN